MSLWRSIERLTRRAFPGFPEHHVTRLGEVVAVGDPPAEEAATDRYRPRYAVDVQLLTPIGEPDTQRPVLRAVPLPATAGLYAFPEVGARVRVGFDYGLPSHPYVVAVVHEGQPAPALRPGERLWRHSLDAFLRFDADGNLTVQTNGELREDSGRRVVEADATEEHHGALTTQVDQDWTQEVAGRLVQQVLGALVQKIAGDVRTAILGGRDTTVAGDDARLVGGQAELVAALDVSARSTLGDVRLESVLGTATLYGTLQAALETLPGGTIAAGNGGVDVLAVLDAVLGHLQKEIHNTGVGPSGPPNNLADYLAEQIKLGLIKS